MTNDISIDDVKRLALEPGDTLVLRVAEHIKADALTELATLLRDAFPEHQAVVLMGDMDLEVVSSA